jgi:hypothetical protein
MKIDRENVERAIKNDLIKHDQLCSHGQVARLAEAALGAVYGPAELRPSGSKGQRWPDGMDVPPDWIDEAQRMGLARDRALVEAQKFVDHWTAATGQNATKRNWRATWRNWVRRVAGDQLVSRSGESHVLY